MSSGSTRNASWRSLRHRYESANGTRDFVEVSLYFQLKTKTKIRLMIDDRSLIAIVIGC